MTAQVAKPKRRLSASDKSQAIALRLDKGLTYEEIGRILKTSKQTIHRNLVKLIPDKTTEIYKDHRADIFSHAQLRILSNVTDAKLKKSSVRDLIVSAGILYDKERLESGLSTSNVAYADMTKQHTGIVEAIKKLQAELGEEVHEIEA